MRTLGGPSIQELLARAREAEREQAANEHAARLAPSREDGKREVPREVESYPVKPWSNAGVRRELGRRGWAVIYSRTLGEPVLWLRDANVAVPERWRRYVSYTLVELEALRGVTPDQLRELHLAKRMFGGMILRPEEAHRVRAALAGEGVE